MNAFQLQKQDFIPTLNIQAQIYKHSTTGAEHIHLHSPDNDENVFMVALRTVPEDSTGVAHILEHTTLCGSRKYPVRDPFFMMNRRSLNSFMNAMTSSDWTAYPFASNNVKDFKNLLQVYLDSVFFPNLDELDFAQEGHRFEFSEIDNPESELEYKGVVYNEMKGAMSSPVSVVWHSLCEHLYPTSTYGHNSGGNPEDIPQLTYQQLKDFHRKHYHPSNAIFMTYGNMEAEQHQLIFEALVLQKFEADPDSISVAPEQRIPQPINVSKPLAVSSPDKEADGSHLVMGWLLGDSTNLKQMMEAELLSAVLLEDSASPLLHVLETTNLGQSPSPLCGVDSSQREICFVCGLESVSADNAQTIEDLILECLMKVADEGVPIDRLQASLHQIELQQREITGDSYPYGLQLLMSCLPSAIHRGEVIESLNLDNILLALRKDIEDPNYIKSLCRKLLVDNPHRVRLCMVADANLNNEKLAQEKQQLASIQQQLSELESQAIIDRAVALKQRQEQIDNPELLPKVTLSDISTDIVWAEGQHHSVDNYQLTQYSAGTNGIVYQHQVAKLPQLNEQQLQLLPILSYLMTEVAVGDLNYLQVQQWQSRVCGSINASYQFHHQLSNVNQGSGYFVVSGKALNSNQDKLAELINATFKQARFDEHERIHSLLAQASARNDNRITGSGHLLAMQAASKSLSTTAWLHEHLSGLDAIKRLKAWLVSFEDKSVLVNFCRQLHELHQLLLNIELHTLFIAEPNQLNSFQSLWQQQALIASQSDHYRGPCFEMGQYPVDNNQAAHYWHINSQVNFCAKAYPTVPASHPDSAALMVLGPVLNNNFLHRQIREQGGAYGGGATQNNDAGVFRFYSYRDPRLEGTLADFDDSLQWALQNSIQPRFIEEAILGIVSSIDKPLSPAGLAKQAFYTKLTGRSKATRMQLREAIMNVTEEDIKGVIHQYLYDPNKAHCCVIGGEQTSDTLSTYQVLQL